MMLSLSALTSFGIHRLQSLSNRVDPIVRKADESTAEFFIRQTQFIQDVAIPLSVQVVRETFLLAAVIAALAIIPVYFLARPERD